MVFLFNLQSGCGLRARARNTNFLELHELERTRGSSRPVGVFWGQAKLTSCLLKVRSPIMRGLGGMRLPSKLDQKMFVQLKCSFPNGGVNQQQAFRTNPTQTPPLLGGWLSLRVSRARLSRSSCTCRKPPNTSITERAENTQNKKNGTNTLSQSICDADSEVDLRKRMWPYFG